MENRNETYLSPQQLAIRWNAPMHAVYVIALGQHRYAARVGRLLILSRAGHCYFPLREVMALERKFAQARVSLSQVVEELR
ncbi:MAG: hypothetical protein NTU59_06500 [Coprothermobacterota bacterium]|nr:hypothetical protein [Coprothermobacterota bacterium]